VLVSHTIVGNGSYRSRTSYAVPPERQLPFQNGSYRFRTACAVPERQLLFQNVAVPERQLLFQNVDVPERQLLFQNGICHGMSVVAVAHATGQ
jgi:hypothetical protein